MNKHEERFLGAISCAKLLLSVIGTHLEHRMGIPQGRVIKASVDDAWHIAEQLLPIASSMGNKMVVQDAQDAVPEHHKMGGLD